MTFFVHARTPPSRLKSCKKQRGKKKREKKGEGDIFHTYVNDPCTASIRSNLISRCGLSFRFFFHFAFLLAYLLICMALEDDLEAEGRKRGWQLEPRQLSPCWAIISQSTINTGNVSFVTVDIYRRHMSPNTFVFQSPFNTSRNADCIISIHKGYGVSLYTTL